MGVFELCSPDGSRIEVGRPRLESEPRCICIVTLIEFPSMSTSRERSRLLCTDNIMHVECLGFDLDLVGFRTRLFCMQSVVTPI